MNRKHHAYQQWDQVRRDEVVRAHLPMVYSVAHRVAGSVQMDALELADLVQAGVLGLYKALERYDEAKGVPFHAFAVHYVRGSMLDEVAKHRQVPRGLREKQKQFNHAYDTLSQRLLREPTDEELARELGLGTEELHAWLLDLGWTAAFSLEELEAAGSLPVADPEPAVDPAAYLDAKERRELLVQALRKLTPREQQVLWAYYEEELTLKEIGEVLGLSESQVSRIRSKAIARLRGMLSRHKADMQFAR